MKRRSSALVARLAETPARSTHKTAAKGDSSMSIRRLRRRAKVRLHRIGRLVVAPAFFALRFSLFRKFSVPS
jgi:hypothetical protein